MAPYIIIFFIGITGSALFFPNCEISLIAFYSIGAIAPFSVFGHEINLADYHAELPWLLAFCCALGSTIGSSMYYFVGKGARRISPKLQKQLDKFNFEKFEKSSIAVTLSSSTFSLPPVTILSLAAGMTKFPFWFFMGLTFLGKNVRFLIVVYTGGGVIDVIRRLLGF